MNQKDLAKKIKKAMIDAGLNQKDLARKLNITQVQISQWIIGNRNPSLSSLKKIAAATGKPLKYFLEDDKEINSSQGEYKEINIIKEMMLVPIMGTSSATREKFILEEQEGFLNIPKSNKNQFAIKVEGDCMVDPQDTENSIYHGNYIIVDPDIVPTNGDVIVARIDKEYSTIKRMFINNDEMRLIPDNPSCNEIIKKVKEVEIIGKIVNVYRPVKKKSIKNCNKLK